MLVGPDVLPDLGVVIHPALLTESRRLLDRARMIAEAPASREPDLPPPVRAEGSRRAKARPHSHGVSAPPPGAWGFETSTLEACGGRINRAIAHDSDAELRAANAWCAHEIDTLQHGSAGGAETPLEFRVRVCVQYEGVLAGVVARTEMTSVTTVRKFRSEDGREPRTGRRLMAVERVES